MTRIIPQTKQILTKQRGTVLITVALLMFVLLGFGAFAIDFGYSYMIKNELQNAADVAALAGASVLFSDNDLCISNDSPYSCCTGSKTGSCNPSVIDDDNVVTTAQTVAAKNNSGGNPVPTPTVEIGHYTFNASRGSPGTFTVASTYQQMENWQTVSFSTLNGNTSFINAVRAKVSRTDVPRFFSRIWGSADLAITAEAVAYVGFAGTLVPGEADQPIAICEQSIKNGSSYTCNVGTMLNNNTQTARWTNLEQEPCGTSNDGSVGAKICKNGNTHAIVFGEGMSTTNGTHGNNVSAMYDCWKDNAKFDSDGDGVPDKKLDTDGDGKPDKPWKITLPVIDCDCSNPGTCTPTQNCKKVTGAVVVDVVWIADKNDGRPTGPKPWVPTSMYNPNTNITWSRSSSGCSSETACWNSFRTAFNLKGNNLQGDAEWAEKTVYFLPDCKVHAPTGNTGGENYGILARYPVLVPY